MAARARSPSWTSAPSRGVSRGRGVAAWPGAAGSSPAPTKGNLMFPTVIGRWLVCAIGAPLLASPAALAAAPHRVLPGETLWSISAANNLTTRTVAIYNGLSENAQLLAGTTIHVPTVEEGAAALGSGARAVAPPATTGAGGGTAPV